MVVGPITVVQMLPGLEGGGVERGTLEMGAFLTRKGHTSLVISGGGRMVRQLESEGSIHINWRVGAKTPICLTYILPLRRLLKEKKVDVLHLRSRLPAWIGYLAWKSLPKDRRPILITTFHGFYSVNAYSAVMTKGQKIIAISNIVKDHIQEKYKIPEDRITVIYRGVDDSIFDPEKVSNDRINELRKCWNLNRIDGPIIMLPGRITRLKGHDVFLRSLAMIQNMAWHAVIVGDTKENPNFVEELKKIINASGMENRVHFVGYCDDMPAALMLSDIVVSATSGKPEAFGRTAVEAQAMGKPVNASAHGGSLETVLPGKTGWLVKPGDANEMAGALRQSLTDESMRKTFGEQGRKWVRENFTVEHMCRKTLDLYRQLLRDTVI